MDVVVNVQPDGRADITEHLTLSGDPAGSPLRRSPPVGRHDGISALRESRAGHDLSLNYSAANVVAISGIRGLLSWSVLPAHRDWDASAVSIRVNLPESAVLLEDPWVDESGWTVARLPHGMTATRAFVPAAESATIGIEFTIDQLSPTKPQWQSDQELSDEFVPAFIAAALFILVTGVGILVMLRIKHPPWRVSPAQAATAVDAKAADLTEAMRLALRRGRSRGDRTVVAALEAAGLFDRERVRTARDLRVAGWVVMAFGVAVWVTVALTVTQFGAWPLLVPWSILMVGLMFAIASSRVTLLSETGARVRMLYFARVRDGRASE